MLPAAETLPYCKAGSFIFSAPEYCSLIIAAVDPTNENNLLLEELNVTELFSGTFPEDLSWDSFIIETESLIKPFIGALQYSDQEMIFIGWDGTECLLLNLDEESLSSTEWEMLLKPELPSTSMMWA